MDVFLKTLRTIVHLADQERYPRCVFIIVILEICLVSYKSKSNRTPDKNQLTSQRKQKRQKSTPKKEVKHIPIDLFFVKNNQKF